MRTVALGALLLTLVPPCRAQVARFDLSVERVVKSFHDIPTKLERFRIQDASLDPATVRWEELAPPAPAVVEWLKIRIPDLRVPILRELPQDAFVRMLEDACTRKRFALDVFSDESLREAKLYYISQATLAEVDKRYELSSLFPPQGTTIEGYPFVMQGLVMGGGKVEMLYSLDSFTFKHPIFKGHGGRFRFPARVVQTILGPGSVALDNIHGPWNADIQKIFKVSPTRAKIVTNLADDEIDLVPIFRKQP